MLRLACALGALQTVADAFPAIPLVPRVRCAPQTPVASMRPPRIAAFAVAGEPGVAIQEGGWSRPLVLVFLVVIGAISLRDPTRGQWQGDSSEEDLIRNEVNTELNLPPNFEGLVLGCIDADFCK